MNEWNSKSTSSLCKEMPLKLPYTASTIYYLLDLWLNKHYIINFSANLGKLPLKSGWLILAAKSIENIYLRETKT